MGNSPKQNAEKYKKSLSAWETLAPNKIFSGMSLDDFRKIAQTSFDIRTQLEALEKQIINLKNTRDDSDKVTTEKLLMIVSSILGDPTEGPDSALYEAMGYVRRSERKKGLIRKTKEAKPAKKSAAKASE